jgi:hypothetical protein
LYQVQYPQENPQPIKEYQKKRFSLDNSCDDCKKQLTHYDHQTERIKTLLAVAKQKTDHQKQIKDRRAKIVTNGRINTEYRSTSTVTPSHTY